MIKIDVEVKDDKYLRMNEVHYGIVCHILHSAEKNHLQICCKFISFQFPLYFFLNQTHSLTSKQDKLLHRNGA
jgi:hypothetical protein